MPLCPILCILVERDFQARNDIKWRMHEYFSADIPRNLTIASRAPSWLAPSDRDVGFNTIPASTSREIRRPCYSSFLEALRAFDDDFLLVIYLPLADNLLHECWFNGGTSRNVRLHLPMNTRLAPDHRPPVGLTNRWSSTTAHGMDRSCAFAQENERPLPGKFKRRNQQRPPIRQE
ncbi:hypothetical protein PROFUN_09786 [Planoprotostelium fungivorum]|uniref:Uncharacterized protein n=1 Tax=Planoprotostelium fungivorum TaxID=1890364 RepID=A0A2P6NGM9_9EUKA|nr:hypothetical protein PROFUN_09786 [Planoprotostelium fungivorum]